MMRSHVFSFSLSRGSRSFQRDTTAVLKRFVRLFDPRFFGLTGSPQALDALYAHYYVWHKRLPANSSAGGRFRFTFMRWSNVAVTLGVVLVLLAGTARAVFAAEYLHGVVVSLLPSRGEAVVRHQAFGGMPAMTMVFQVEPRDVFNRLQVGDRITARVDMKADPARIDQIHVVGHTSPTKASSVLHDVQPLDVGDALPDTTFFDQLGRAFSFTDFRGQTLLIAFVYTRCQDPRMCPLISSNFHQLQTKLAGLPIHLIEITLDPAYDTPAVLRRYGRLFGADPDRWTMGTGPVKVVDNFAARFGIAVFADPTAGLIHSERTAVVDRNGAIVDMIDEAAWSPDDVAAKLRSVASLPSNPIARLDYELGKASQAICGNNMPGTAGLLALGLVVAILAAASWILYRAARKIFIEEP